jgi:hypothetical protein
MPKINPKEKTSLVAPSIQKNNRKETTAASKDRVKIKQTAPKTSLFDQLLSEVSENVQKIKA